MSGRSRLTSRRSRLRGRWPSRRWRWATGIVGLLLAGGALWTIAPFWRIAGQFGETPARIPSRLFESPPVLETGTRIADADLVALFVARGYREAMDPGPLPVGRYRQDAQRLAVQLRPFPSPSGMTRAVELSIEVEGNRIARLDLGGQRVESVWIDPRLLATYYSPRLADVWPVRVDELPRHAIEAVLAAEDIGFFRHPGLSLNGILRALWVNFRGGRIQQGGSTLTQQLVKNLYLTADRTWARKAREAVLAVLLELRYEKRQILQAYLNEIFLGRVGPVNLVGIGSASRAYFGVPASELSLTEAATLAGLIRSPSRLSPVAHPEELRARRNEVLARMAELGWLDAEVMRGAQDAALGVREPSLDLRRARYAADAAASEARRRFGLPGLEDRGYTVISTLDFDDQIAAEKWLGWGASRVDGRSRRGTGRVEAALLSADPHDGRVLAWVGGRDYAVSQFDRIRFAKRQPGSAFKPVVLAAAFAERTATPSALLVDEPITVHQGSQEWSPNNDDLEFRGVVSVRQAIEQSLNVPTVRLALDVGLERVISWGRELGIESPMAKVPSLALGAFEVTPLELLRVFATLAAGGVASELHLVEAVLDRDGTRIVGRALAAPKRVLDAGSAFMVTSVLEGVVERGTGRGVRTEGLDDIVAGKTGTSSGGRDGWFIGYTPGRVTLSWVGYDDGREADLYGSQAALPSWARFMKARRPVGGYGLAPAPAAVTTVTIDPETGGLATSRCPQVVAEVFFVDQRPRELCPAHDARGWWSRAGRRRREPPGDGG